MLSRQYRFMVQNTVGVTASGIFINGLRKKFDSTGSLYLESTPISMVSGLSIANNTYASGNTIDNSSDKYLGGDFEVVGVFNTGSPSGDLVVYFNRSVDGNNFDDNGLGDVVSVLTVIGTGTKRVTFEI